MENNIATSPLNKEEIVSFEWWAERQLSLKGTDTFTTFFLRENKVAIVHYASTGSCAGLERLFLVTKNSEGQILFKEFYRTKDYITVSVEYDKAVNVLVVSVRSGGTMSGTPWDKTIEVDFSDLEYLPH